MSEVTIPPHNATGTWAPTNIEFIEGLLANTTDVTSLEKFINSWLAITVAGMCAFAATLISLFTIYRHLSYYVRPALQKNVVRILFIVPFYASLSWFSLVFPEGATFLDSVRDVWEAFVVYSFLMLMLEYCGGENNCLSVIMNHPGAISHTWPLRKCMAEIRLDAKFMRKCKQGTLQFTVIKPIFAVSNLAMLSVGRFDDPTYQTILFTVYNISYTVALYSLLMFYFATREHPGLVGRRPVLKFVSVKMIIFATYYQTILVDIAPGIPKDTLALFNNFILCCEMVLFAILHRLAFNWAEFSQVTGVKTNRDDAIGNARDVISMTDVASDAYHSFNRKYGSHVLLDTTNDRATGGTGMGKNGQYISSGVHGENGDGLSFANSNSQANDGSVDIEGAVIDEDRVLADKSNKKFNVKSALFGNLRDFGSAMFPRVELMGATEENEEHIDMSPISVNRNNNSNGITEIELSRPSSRASSPAGAAVSPTNDFSNPFAPVATAGSGAGGMHNDMHQQQRSPGGAGHSVGQPRVINSEAEEESGGGGGEADWADFSDIEFGASASGSNDVDGVGNMSLT